MQTQYVTPQGVIVDGTMNKLHDCEVIDVAARTNQRARSRAWTFSTSSPGTATAPAGSLEVGPWLIWAPEVEGVTIFVRHRCNRCGLTATS